MRRTDAKKTFLAKNGSKARPDRDSAVEPSSNRSNMSTDDRLEVTVDRKIDVINRVVNVAPDQSRNGSTIPSPQAMIVKLLEAKRSRRVITHAGMDLNVLPTRSGLTVPAWITVGTVDTVSSPAGTDLTNTMIYNFNIFNTDPTHVNQETLQLIINALKKDCDDNYRKDYGMTVTFNLYGVDDLKRVELFQGDRMPVFIGQYGNGAFHYVNTPEPTNTYSFPTGGGKLAAYGIVLPNGSKMDFVPYSIISSNDVTKFYGSPTNIYAVSPETVPNDTYHQIISMSLSHEVREMMGNDTTLSWTLFDHYAPTVANWHWGVFNGTSCKNGIIGKSGYVELPPFLKHFPSGGLFFAVKENGDVVSASFAGLMNSYYVDGWLIENYPLRTFWNPYNSGETLQYDRLGYVQNPLEPYGGLHELIFFVSFDTGVTHLLEVQNKGPVTYKMRGAPADNNFPPNYVYVRELTSIKPGTNVHQLLEIIENYGPSNPDRT